LNIDFPFVTFIIDGQGDVMKKKGNCTYERISCYPYERGACPFRKIPKNPQKKNVRRGYNPLNTTPHFQI